MRVWVKSASAVVQRTLEQAVVASGHTVCVPEDAELMLSDQLNPIDDTPKSACVMLSSAHSSSIHAMSVPVTLHQLLRAFRAPLATPHLALGNGWRLDLTERRALHAQAGSVSFTEKECELLTVLIQAHPEALARETLLAKVWGMRHDVDTHTLETHIYRLRQKLEGAHPTPGDILTEGGAYRIILDEA